MKTSGLFDPYHLPQTASPTYKSSPNSPGKGGTVLEVLAGCVPSLPGKE